MNFRTFFSPISNRLLVCLVFILNLSSALATAPPTFKISGSPAWKTQIPIPEKNFEASGDITYLLLDCQKNALIHEANYRYVLRLNNEEGVQNNSQITLTFDPTYQKLIINKILIHRGSQVIDHLKREEIEVMRNEQNTDRFIYDGTYSAINIIKDVRKGDVLEYEYTIKGENPIFADQIYWYASLSYGFELLRNYQQLIVPKSEKLIIRPIRNGQQPKISESANSKSLVWDLSDCPAVYNDANIPSWYNAYSACEITSFGSWGDVKQWGIKLYPYNVATPEIDAFINSKKIENPEQRIISAIRFVQNEVRYMGIEIGGHSHQPHNPEEVFKNRFGDCKDKSYLLTVMLRKIGVPAWPALVNTYNRSEVENNAPSPFAFNHVIVKFRLENQNYWVDPTINQQSGPLSLLCVPNYGRALVLGDEEDGLEKIPVSDKDKVVIKEYLSFPDSASDAIYRVKSVYYGILAAAKRSDHTGTPVSKIRENYINFCSAYYPTLRWANDSALQFTDHPNENSFEVIESYQIPNFWNHNETDSVDFYASVYAYNLYEFLSSSKDKARTMPLAVYYPIDVDQTIEIHFPKNKDIGFEAKKDSIVNHAFSFYFIADINKKQHIYTLKYRYHTKTDNVPADEQKAYFKDYKKLSNLCEQYIRWGVDLAPTRKISWIAVLVSILFIGIAVWVLKQIYRLDLGFEANNKKPIPIGGWLIIPIIGIYVSPVLLLYQLFHIGYFSQSAWNNFLALHSSALLMGSFFYFELLFNLSVTAFSVFLIILQIKRRATLPTFYIWFRLISIVGLLIDTVLSVKVLNVNTGDYSAVIREFVGVAIWVPYFMISTRVSETFVNTYKKPEVETKIISSGEDSNISPEESDLSESSVTLPD